MAAEVSERVLAMRITKLYLSFVEPRGCLTLPHTGRRCSLQVALRTFRRVDRPVVKRGDEE